MLLTDEIWTPICGYASDLYEVSSLGRFRAKCDIIAENGSRFFKKGDTVYSKDEIIPSVSSEYSTVSLYVPKSPKDRLTIQ